MKRIFIFLLTIVAPPLHAQEHPYRLLEGKVGEYSIVMRLVADDTSCEATYFYKTAKRDIELKGMVIRSKLMLYASGWNAKIKREDTIEALTIEQSGNGTYTGTWTNKKTQLPVLMHVTDIKKVGNPFAELPYVKEQEKEEPLNYLRIAAMKIVADSTVRQGSFTLEYVHVENTKVGLFHIKGRDKPILDKINTVLDNALIEYASRSFSCSYYQYSIRNLYITDNIISINIFEDYDCGGAHPDNGIVPININTKTGEIMVLEDVLYLTSEKVPESQSDAWLTYRHEVYAPKLIALLKQLHPNEMKDKDEGEPCNYGQDYIWDYAQWYLTDKGLYLSPSFPHVVAICRDPLWSIIPYKVLRKYKNPHIDIAL